MSDNVFILSWDMYGLESCIDATDLDKQYMWRTLQGNETPNPINSQLQALILRAKMNHQRHYEIYSIATVSEISKKDIIRQFEENPQGMAELIRERGTKIYSDRADLSKVKIT